MRITTPPKSSTGPAATPSRREKIGTRYVSLGVRILVDPADPEDIKQVHALQDAITVDAAGRSGALRSAQLGSGEPEEGARRAAGAGRDPPRHEAHVRSQRPGRSCSTPDRNSVRPSAAIPRRMRSISTSRRARTTARRPPAHGQGRAGRRLLVDQRLQRRGPLPEERVRRLHPQQYDSRRKTRTLGRFGFYVNPFFARTRSDEGSGRIEARVRSDTTMVGLGGLYRLLDWEAEPDAPGPRGGQLEALAGVRVTDMRTEINGRHGLPKFDDSKTWADPIVGLGGRLSSPTAGRRSPRATSAASASARTSPGAGPPASATASSCSAIAPSCAPATACSTRTTRTAASSGT